MSLQHLKFDAIVEADLARLVAEGIPESKTIEYKETLVYVTDEQKREFLSDITALANTDGGDLILGMKATKGVAADLVGLKNIIPDDAIGKIENLLRDFVQPRLLGVLIRPVLQANGNTALLIRAPRSFSAPHMIRHQGITRFCGRNASGKYDLDVHELRSAFVASESLSERLKTFRLDRINRLVSGGTPVPMAGTHFLVMHILPVIGARADTRIPTTEFQKIQHSNLITPIASNGYGPSFNFDGMLIASSWRDRTYHSYVQILRNGFVEAVESRTLEPRENQNEGQEPLKCIPSIAWEKRLINALPGYIKALSALQIPPPYALSVSLLHVKGFMMYVGPNWDNYGSRLVDRDHLLTDEILIESADEPAAKLLRPLFDQVWNACGWHGSINYDEAGNWREHR